MRSVSRTTMLLALSLASSCGALVMGPSKAAPAMSRRAAVSRTLLGAAGAASSLLPLPSVAVAPPSPQQILKSRAVYGSRVYRLQDATPAVIIDEKNAFTLFITGVFGSTVDKPTKKALEKLETAALAAAGKGDAATAQKAVRDFIALGQITVSRRRPLYLLPAVSPSPTASISARCICPL